MIDALPDSGSQVNLISKDICEQLQLPSKRVKQAINLGSIEKPKAIRLTHQVRVRHRLGKAIREDDFYVAPLQGSPQMVLGTPWMKNHKIGRAHV